MRLPKWMSECGLDKLTSFSLVEKHSHFEGDTLGLESLLF